MEIYEHNFEIQYPEVNKKNVLSTYGFFKFYQEMGCLHADKLGIRYEDSSPNWFCLDFARLEN